MIRPSDVSSDHEMPSGLAGWVKQVVPGKIALAVWRRWRGHVRARAAANRQTLSSEGGPTGGHPAARTTSRAVVLIPVGPGERGWLADTVASVTRYAAAAQVVLLADGANDLARADLEAELPGAIFQRSPGLSGGPPRLSPSIAWGYRWCLSHLDFEVLVKLDVDALLVGPGLLERITAAVVEDPSLGMIGTPAMRDGATPGDTSFGRWVVASERRWAPTVRRADAAARAHGWNGEECHGGVYALSRAALERMRDSGHLDRQPPWWTLVGEDLWFSMGVAGTGLRVGGLPGGPILSGQSRLPIGAQEALDRGALAVHTVKRGRDGEDQAALRAFFRASRDASR